jgi:hypothetical protein
MRGGLARVMIVVAAGIVLGTLMIGAGTGQEPHDAVPSQAQDQARLLDSDVYVHTVQWPRESFTVIAKWYTGDPENWRILARSNPTINYRFVRIGDKIRIPRQLMKTFEPLPKSFVTVQTYAPHSGSSGDSAVQSGDSEKDDFELYGPKE